MNRNNIYAALLGILDDLLTDGSLKTLSRRLEFAEEVDPSRLPGVWQLQIRESIAEYATTGFACWYFDVDWYVYFCFNDESSPTTPGIVPTIDKIMELLPHDDAGNVAAQFVVDDTQITLTLRDGLEYFEGLINNKAVVRIPLRLLVPTA